MIVRLIGSGLEPKEIVYLVIIYIIALTLSFSIHEFMHASVAVWLGDPTPKNMGRVTLNPIAHVDPIGTILLLVAGFGWGKPVMYNPLNLHRFKSRRWMNIMVHLAGVTGNFILGIFSMIFYSLFSHLTIAFEGNIILTTFADLFYCIYTFSMMLLAFNLLPIPPLDGFHVLQELLPYKVRSSQGYRNFERMSPMIIWIVFIVGMVSRISILDKVVNIIQWPFQMIIGFIMIPFEMLFSLIGI